MGLLSRIFGLERRSADQFTYGGPVPDWITARTRSGMAVNDVAAENLATVTACVSAIGSAIGTLPPRVYTPTRRPDHRRCTACAWRCCDGAAVTHFRA